MGSTKGGKKTKAPDGPPGTKRAWLLLRQKRCRRPRPATWDQIALFVSQNLVAFVPRRSLHPRRNIKRRKKARVRASRLGLGGKRKKRRSRKLAVRALTIALALLRRTQRRDTSEAAISWKRLPAFEIFLRMARVTRGRAPSNRACLPLLIPRDGDWAKCVVSTQCHRLRPKGTLRARTLLEKGWRFKTEKWHTTSFWFVILFLYSRGRAFRETKQLAVLAG